MNLHKEIKKAEKLFHSGQYAELEKVCNKLLKQKSNDFQLLHILGLAQEKLGRLDEAISTLELVIKINKGHTEAYCNLGYFYLLAQRLEEAINSCHSAIKLDHNNAEVYNNLGNALLMSQRYNDAEKAYLQALKVNPKKGLALDNLGVCLMKQGRLSDAVDQFLRASEVSPSLSSVYIHLFHVLMFMHNTEDAYRVIDIGLSSGVLQPGEILELLVGKAKIAWLTGQLSETREAIDKSQAIHTGFHSYPNIKALRRFHSYLNLLLIEREKHPELYAGVPEKAMFFVAESHCLSPSETVIQYQKQSHRILSSLITGCKAWHLSKETGNEYKTSLTLLFKALPVNTSVMLGFGEIDCRSTEGILIAHLAGKADYLDSTPDFLEKYVEFACQEAAVYRHNLLFYGVPAPTTTVLARLKPETVELFCLIVKLFNKELERICWQRQLDFLDVYSATADKIGQSNMTYHIDSHHVHPRIIPILFESYLISRASN
jgi:Flp pilus assembly protein TadD